MSVVPPNEAVRPPVIDSGQSDSSPRRPWARPPSLPQEPGHRPLDDGLVDPRVLAVGLPIHFGRTRISRPVGEHSLRPARRGRWTARRTFSWWLPTKLIHCAFAKMPPWRQTKSIHPARRPVHPKASSAFSPPSDEQSPAGLTHPCPACPEDLDWGGLWAGTPTVCGANRLVAMPESR